MAGKPGELRRSSRHVADGRDADHASL